MNHTDIEALLDRYKKGETSPKENEVIENWLLNPNSSQSQWNKMNKHHQDQWLGAVLNNINHTIDARERNVVSLHRGGYLWKSIAAAAAILIVFFSLFLGWPSLKGIATPDKLISLKTLTKGTKQITLSDGSKVWVNGGSELKYPKAFTANTREVYLSGEAYFDIRHNAAQPFIIHTGDLITTVLGTAFDIKEDKNKHTIEVTVTRGKVSVANGDKLLGVLTPNQQISFNSLKNKAVKQSVNANLAIAWLDSEIIFDDVSFEEAALQLQEQFNVKIFFTNQKMKACRFSGTALKGQQLDKILKVICAFNNATFQTKADGSIVIDGPGCIN